MARYKQGTQLFETADPELSLEKKAELADGVTQTPTTALSSGAVGATPKQADMAGTKAAKEAVIKKQAGTSRKSYERSRSDKAAATDDAKARMARAESLKAFGSLATRIPDMLERKAKKAREEADKVERKAAEAAVGEITETSLEAISTLKAGTEDYTKAKASLVNFAASTKDPAAYQTYIEELSTYGITAQEASDLIGDSDAAIASASAAGIKSEEVTLADVDPKDLEAMFPTITAEDGSTTGPMQQAATALGLDLEDAKNLPLDELEEAIESVRAMELSEIASLNAQISSLPIGSATRRLLVAQRSALGEMGIDVAEQETEELIQAMDLDVAIKIGDQEYSISELLGDDKISDVITEYLQEDEQGRLDLLGDDYPELAAWIESNKVALGALDVAVAETAETIEATQSDYANLTSFGSDKPMSDSLTKFLMPDYNAEGVVSAESLATAKAAYEETTFYKLKSIKGVDTALLENINDFSEEDLDTLFAENSAEEINAAWKESKIQEAENATSMEWAGLTSANPLLSNLNASYVKQVKDMAKLHGKLEALNGFSDAGPYSEWIAGMAKGTDGKFTAASLELMADLATTSKEAMSNLNGSEAGKAAFADLEDADKIAFIEDPMRLTRINERQESEDVATNKLSSADDLLTARYGSTTRTEDQLKTLHASLTDWAGRGDQNAIDQLASLEKEFGAKFFSEGDLSTIRANLTSDLAGTESDDIARDGANWKPADQDYKDIYEPDDQLYKEVWGDGGLSQDEMSKYWGTPQWESLKTLAAKAGGSELIKSYEGNKSAEHQTTTFNEVASSVAFDAAITGKTAYTPRGNLGASDNLFETTDFEGFINNVMVDEHTEHVLPSGIYNHPTVPSPNDKWAYTKTIFKDQPEVWRNAQLDDTQNMRDRIHTAVTKLEDKLAMAKEGSSEYKQIEEWLSNTVAYRNELTGVYVEMIAANTLQLPDVDDPGFTAAAAAYAYGQMGYI